MGVENADGDGDAEGSEASGASAGALAAQAAAAEGGTRTATGAGASTICPGKEEVEVADDTVGAMLVSGVGAGSGDSVGGGWKSGEAREVRARAEAALLSYSALSLGAGEKMKSSSSPNSAIK